MGKNINKLPSAGNQPNNPQKGNIRNGAGEGKKNIPRGNIGKGAGDGKKRKLGKRKTKGKIELPKIKENAQIRQDVSTCGADEVDGTCMSNALTCLAFEGGFRNNFNRQYGRYTSFNRSANNKYDKYWRFDSAMVHMMEALGVNSTTNMSTLDINSMNISCHREGANATAKGLEEDNFRSPYTELAKCGKDVLEACKPFQPPNGTFEVMEQCFTLLKDTKKLTEECRKQSNATAQCECWQNMKTNHYDVYREIKDPVRCSYMSQLQKDLRIYKNKCIDVFKACKKAEDSSVELIHDCMNVGDSWNPVTDEKAVMEAAKNLSVFKEHEFEYNETVMSLRHWEEFRSKLLQEL